jgi:hypothetical protein
MAIFLALPFAIIAVVAFFTCLPLKRTRPYAIQAFVAPLAFGAGGLFGLLVAALFSQQFHLSAILITVCCTLPGVASAWISIVVVGRIQRVFLRTNTARNNAVSIVVSFIAFWPLFILENVGLTFIHWHVSEERPVLGLVVLLGALALSGFTALVLSTWIFIRVRRIRFFGDESDVTPQSIMNRM